MSRPRCARFLIAGLLVPTALAAQAAAPRHVAVPPAAPRLEDVSTVDGIIRAYYDVITGPAAQPRQWSRDRSLYIPDLRFVAPGVAQGRPYAHVMTHQDFVDGSDSRFVHEGVLERETHRGTPAAGHLT